MQHKIEVMAGPGEGLAHFDQYKLTVPVGAKIRPHYHETKEETYLFLRGRARIRIGDMENEVGPETLKIIPKRTIHGVQNIGNEPLVIFSTANIAEASDIHYVD